MLTILRKLQKYSRVMRVLPARNKTICGRLRLHHTPIPGIQVRKVGHPPQVSSTQLMIILDNNKNDTLLSKNITRRTWK